MKDYGMRKLASGTPTEYLMVSHQHFDINIEHSYTMEKTLAGIDITYG